MAPHSLLLEHAEPFALPTDRRRPLVARRLAGIPPSYYYVIP